MAEDIYEVDQIIGRRVTSDGKEDYLVRWQSYSPLLSTWEPINNFADCQRAIREFYDKHWPIPGSQATEVLHVENNSNTTKGKQELLTLQALPARKGKKFLRGLPKDLKEEILRLQLESKSSLKNKIVGEEKPPLAITNNLVDHNMKFNGSTIETRKSGMKRKKDDIDETAETAGTTKVSRRNNPKYLRSVKDKHKEPKKSPYSKAKHFKRGKAVTDGISSPQKVDVVTGSLETVSLPSRITRRSLPSCSATCVLEEELVVTQKNGCMFIKFCNEAKKNVINLQMCEKIIGSLHDAGKDDVSLVVFVGSGSSFCYGWDLDQFEDMYQNKKKDSLQKYRLMTRMLITCPKPLVAAVNGPAAGFGVALAALCDIVLAGSKATFVTNFAEWGHPPVGCCSYTLPHLLGTAKAMSMLLLNNQLSASAAQQSGLVSELLEKDFDKQLEANVQRLLSVPTQCLQDTKSLLHENKVQELANVNTEECDFFLKYIVNETTLNNILTRWHSTIRE